VSTGFNLPGTVLVANLWWYSFAVLRPAQLWKAPFRAYRTPDIGKPPVPRKGRTAGKHYYLRHREPVLLEEAPDDYHAVEDFDGLSAQYERIMEPFSQPIFEEVLEVFKPFVSAKSRILDPSCGPGTELLRLARLVPDGEVVGADLAADMVRTAAANARRRGVENAAFFQADVANMPKHFARRFDAIYCAFAFHHYPDRVGALREMRRVLRPGGHVFIVDAGPLWMKTLAAPLARWGDPGWVSFHTGEEFQRFFAEAGFSSFYWTEILPGIGLSVASP
jgi:SAM-dependent methyltransferase